MKPFLYLEGVRTLANQLDGTETIHMGIRPYGYHAGNTLTLEAYPRLLADAIAASGKEPRFTILLSLNDWEQDALDGPDIYKYPFDVGPRHTIIKHMRNGEIMAEWAPRIIKHVSALTEDYPGITVKPVYNSDLLEHPVTPGVIRRTLDSPEQIKEVLLRVSKKPTVGKHMHFCRPICPSCHSLQTEVVTSADSIEVECRKCRSQDRGPYDQFDYWLYHKISFINRLAVYQPDVAISGGDHYLEADHHIRTALASEIFNDLSVTIPKMLFAPILLDANGVKMSKSRMNEQAGSFVEIYELATSQADEVVTYA